MSETTWTRYRLSQIGGLVGGATPSTSVAKYWDGEIAWTTSKRLADPVILTSGERFITQLGLENSSTTLIPPDNLLIGTRVGVGKVVVTGLPIAVNQDLTGLILDHARFDPVFVAYSLRTDEVQREFASKARGTTIKGIPRQDVGSITIAAPDLATQRRIGALLQAVQRTVELEERLAKTAGELKQAAMRNLFTRGLRAEPQKETEIGMLPESWDIRRIDEEMQLTAGGTPARSTGEYWDGGTIPWVKTGEVDYCVIEDTQERITLAGLENSAAKLLPAGSVLVAMYGQGVTRGKVAMLGIEAATNQACLGLLAKSDQTNPAYLYYYLTFSYERLRSLSHGAQQQNLNRDIIASLCFPRPHLDEQCEIVSILEEIDRRIDADEKKKSLLEELFDTLLEELMSGRCSVADIDAVTNGDKSVAGRAELITNKRAVGQPRDIADVAQLEGKGGKRRPTV